MVHEAKGRLFAVLLSGALALCGAIVPAHAAEADESWATPTAPLAEESETFAYDNDLPGSFDLRNTPGIVSPVRYQSPWSTCWSFGPICAAETAINSRFGTRIDLSERHLAWFGLTPVEAIDDPGQKGEGVYYFGGEKFHESPHAKYDTGAYIATASSLLASGAGPVLESSFPYHGAQGRTLYDLCVSHPRLWKDELHATLLENCGSDEEILLNATVNFNTVEDLLEASREETIRRLRSGEMANAWSELDDWTISSTDENGRSNRSKSAGYVLEKSECMPRFATIDAKTKAPTIDMDCMQAVKQELMEGRAVAVAYYSDSSAVDPQTKHSLFYNEDKACHYLWSDDPDIYDSANHVVAIVGWDDAYPKENFVGTTTHGGKKVDKPAPPGDGAWIIRNSWGSKDGCDKPLTPDAPVIGKVNYGHEGSGYFYISYYDLSLSDGESLDFSRSLDNGAPFITNQYDYLPCIENSLVYPSKDVISSANVFTAGQDQRVVSLGVRTVSKNTEVTYGIYRLREGATDPTDGERVSTFTITCGFSGYYRHDLPVPVVFREGERFSVVVTKSYLDDGQRLYEVSAAAVQDRDTAARLHAKFLEENKERVAKGEDPYTDKGIAYGVTVVNPGESFIYTAGDRWLDWSEYQKMPEFTNKADGRAVDNFCIKAFATALGDEEADLAYTCVTGDNQTLRKGTDDLTCALACTQEDRDAYDHFLSASIDGRPLASSAYVLTHRRESGQAVLTIGATTLSALGAGRHTLTVAFDNGGAVDVTFTLVEGTGTPGSTTGWQSPWHRDHGHGTGGTGYATYSSDTASGATGTSPAGVRRLAGRDRFETMAQVIREGFQKSDVVIVTSGTGFADALSAAALAGAHAAPVVLCEESRLGASAEAEIARLGATRAIILGGTAAVSDAAERALRELVPDVTRVAGADRQQASVAAFLEARAARPVSDTVVVASGSSFADALSIGSWSWKSVSPIVLARDGLLSAEAVEAITGDAAIRRVVIVGGTACVSDQVKDQLGDGYDYVRLGGADRYETSALVASWATGHGLGWNRPVVATGTGFADALAGTPTAGTLSSPVLLVDGTDCATIQRLRENRSSVGSVLVLGGTAAVSDACEQALVGALS